MRVAYLDCFAGIAGDMLLGALVDAGVPRSVLEDATEALGIGASLRFESVDRSGITAMKVHVLDQGRDTDSISHAEPEMQKQVLPLSQHTKIQHQHRSGHHAILSDPSSDQTSQKDPQHDDEHGRSLTEIRNLIRASRLTEDVKELSIRAFEMLGASEAKIHNMPVDEIHFHEVGAVDAIVDIVASAAGIAHLGMDRWHCSPVNVGSGTVRCAHGLFPVPAPATADLLRGIPTYAAHLAKELTTPTGAALLRAVAPVFGSQPVMQVDRIGYGAGTRNPTDFPNVLRLCVGEATTASFTTENTFPPEPNMKAQVAVIETALDDASPQLLAYVAEQALHTGAMDVMLTPVIMKKGRPGTLLTLLAQPEDAKRLEQFLLRETTTLGVRMRLEWRSCLDRAHVEVRTEFGTVRVKIGTHEGEVWNANPEFEDCRQLAETCAVPLKRVHAAAMNAYLNEKAAGELSR